MRGTRAKALRRAVIGDFSPKVRKYQGIVRTVLRRLHPSQRKAGEDGEEVREVKVRTTQVVEAGVRGKYRRAKAEHKRLRKANEPHAPALPRRSVPDKRAAAIARGAAERAERKRLIGDKGPWMTIEGLRRSADIRKAAETMKLNPARVTARLVLGATGNSPETSLVIGEVDLIRALRVRSIHVEAGEPTVANVEIVPDRTEAEVKRVVLPEDALRFLAESAGYYLVKRSDSPEPAADSDPVPAATVEGKVTE